MSRDPSADLPFAPSRFRYNTEPQSSFYFKPSTLLNFYPFLPPLRIREKNTSRYQLTPCAIKIFICPPFAFGWSSHPPYFPVEILAFISYRCPPSGNALSSLLRDTDSPLIGISILFSFLWVTFLRVFVSQLVPLLFPGSVVPLFPSFCSFAFVTSFPPFD